MIYMTVAIQIHYIAIENNVKCLRRWEVRLGRKKPEQVAYEWWKQIKRESFVDLELEKVIADGEDITNLVKELEKAPLE